MLGDSESASKNTSKLVDENLKYSNIRIFENSLASDLVFVAKSWYRATTSWLRRMASLAESTGQFIRHSAFSMWSGSSWAERNLLDMSSEGSTDLTHLNGFGASWTSKKAQFPGILLVGSVEIDIDNALWSCGFTEYITKSLPLRIASPVV